MPFQVSTPSDVGCFADLAPPIFIAFASTCNLMAAFRFAESEVFRSLSKDPLGHEFPGSIRSHAAEFVSSCRGALMLKVAASYPRRAASDIRWATPSRTAGHPLHFRRHMYRTLRGTASHRVVRTSTIR